MRTCRLWTKLAASLLLCWAGVTQPPACGQDAGADRRDDSTSDLVFRNVRVFDGTEFIPATTVVVSDGKIEGLGEDQPIPAGARVIDGTGKTLLPGLIDCHTHTFLPGQLQQAAAFGVTTELDMAADPGLAANLRRGPGADEPLRADLYSAGTPVTAPGGHPTQLPWFVQIPTISSPDQAAQFVKDRIDEGSDYIKLIYDDGGAYGLRFPTISRETMAAVVKEAHARGKLAVAHISTRQAARHAIEADVDGLVHLFLDEPLDRELLQLAVERKVFIIPTLTVLESASGTPSGASLVEDALLQDYLLPDDVTNLMSTFPRQESSKADYAIARQAARQFAEAGVPLLAGSDAPNPGTAHGVSLHRELELLVEAGLAPRQALAAGTSVAARHFQLSDRGRIASGLIADLVLIEGDPSEDIRRTRQIVGVWKRGEPVDRGAYRQQVETVRAQQQQPAGAAPRPATENGLVSGFEDEEVRSDFGSGWMVSTDLFVGGKSTAQFQLHEGGAQDSERSLLISGNIDDRPEPRWAGATFSPGDGPMMPADLSSNKSLSFWAKGDGKQYYVMLFFQKRGFFPSMKTFEAGDQWKQHRFELKDFDGCDGTDVTGVFFGGGVAVGPFSVQLDDVRFEQ